MAKEGFVNIHGKEYKTVAKRVQEFRESVIYKEWSIMTEIVKIDDDQCVMKAIIISPENKVIATGHGCEFKASSQINKTSYVEKFKMQFINKTHQHQHQTQHQHQNHLLLKQPMELVKHCRKKTNNLFVIWP